MTASCLARGLVDLYLRGMHHECTSMLFIGSTSMQHKETRVCNAGLPTKTSTLTRGLHLDWSFDASLVGTCTLLMR